MKTPDVEIARQVASAIGKPLYQQRFLGSHNENAAAELLGRSYYYTSETRKMFRSRVLLCFPMLEGLIFYTTESYYRSDDEPRRYRAVLFDLLGSVLYRSGQGLPFTDELAGGFRNHELAIADAKEAVSRIGTVRQEAKRVLAQHKANLRSELKQACSVRI